MFATDRFCCLSHSANHKARSRQFVGEISKNHMTEITVVLEHVATDFHVIFASNLKHLINYPPGN